MQHSNTTSSIFGIANRSVNLPFGLHFPDRRSSISRLPNNPNSPIDVNLGPKKTNNSKAKNKDKENNFFEDDKYKSTSTMLSAMTTTADSCINTSIITSSTSRNTSADSIPLVVLTPESPPAKDDFPCRFSFEDGNERRRPAKTRKLLYSPYGNRGKENRGVVVCGKVSSLTAAHLDVDMESLSSLSSETSSSSSVLSDSSTEEDVGICSLSTTTLSQGAVHLVKQGSIRPFQSTAFTTIRRNTVSISSSSSSDGQSNNSPACITERQSRLHTPINVDSPCNSANTEIMPSPSVIYNDKTKLDLCHTKEKVVIENPFHKTFTRRKQFYQRFCEQETTMKKDMMEQNKLVWRRHCSLCCDEKPCPNKDDPTLTHHRLAASPNENTTELVSANRITFNANIEPFPPFTIHHDGIYGIDGQGKMMGSLCQFNEDTRSEDQNEEQNESFLDVRGGNGIRTFPSFSGRRGSQSGSRLGQLGAKNNHTPVLSNGGSINHSVTRGDSKYGNAHNKTNSDGDIVHYATSTINSEDGVESHLEVSLGKDGDTVIKTRHKLLAHSASNSNLGIDGYGNTTDQGTTISNSSVLRLQYAADGKTLNISSSQKLLPNLSVQQTTPAVPNCLNPAAYMPMLQGPRPSSAYYTQQCPFNPKTEFPERYNSLPNLYGRPSHQFSDSASGMLYDGSSGSPWVYQSYPADEEKRVAYTRSEIQTMLLI